MTEIAATMNQLKLHALQRALYFGAILLWLILCSACHADSPPARFPDLNGTVWVGKDFDGKKYEITLHQKDGKPAPSTVPKQWIASGTATLVTDPDQKVKSCTYSLMGPSGNFAHHPGEDAPTYTIQFNWSGTPYNWPGSLHTDGMLWPGNDQITFNNVEPLVLDIDWKTLFGNDYKGKQWYGEVINCAGEDISVRVEICPDANSVREGLDGTLNSDGSVIMPGPKDWAKYVIIRVRLVWSMFGKTCSYKYLRHSLN
ncbi:MAG: hypothetical protein WDO13_06550 [Verrucomicrobiota bacterium]